MAFYYVFVFLWSLFFLRKSNIVLSNSRWVKDCHLVTGAAEMNELSDVSISLELRSLDTFGDHGYD